MLYLSWTEGFKSGGFTSADDGAPAELTQSQDPADFLATNGRPYDPTLPADDYEFKDEEVTAFEIGGKHTLLDGGMTLNWAAFYTTYKNLQTSIFKGISFGVSNAAKAEVKGVEFDALWQATEELRLGMNIAYLDAKFKSYPTAPCTALQLDSDPECGLPADQRSIPNANPLDNDLSGQSTTFAPEVSGSLFFDYEVALGSALNLFVGGEANYSDEFSTQGDNDPIDISDSYTKMNLRVGLRGAADNWEVMLYGRNLTDEQVSVYGFDIPVLAGSHAAMFDEGRVMGLRGRFTF